MSLIATIGSIITGGLLREIGDIAETFARKEISKAEFDARVKQATLDALTKNEQAVLDAAARSFESFQQTVRSSPVVARAYVAVLVSQTFVLLWYQWGASAFKYITGDIWPSAGTTTEWAYLLVALCLGGGPFVFRQAGVADKLTSWIGKK